MKIILTGRNKFMLLVAITVFIFGSGWMDKMLRFFLVGIPLLLFELSSKRLDKHLTLLFLMLLALVIGIFWDSLNEIGRVIFPFVWCIVTTKIYLPPYLTRKYGVTFSTNREDMLHEHRKRVAENQNDASNDDNHHTNPTACGDFDDHEKDE